MSDEIFAQHTVRVPNWAQPVVAVGEVRHLSLHKTAFLSSQRYPARAVAPSFDWAEKMRDSGQCVISGFHSFLEENIREVLLMGQQPLIWAIPRAHYRRIPPWAKEALAAKRLLILSPCAEKQPSARSTDQRNRFVLAAANAIVVGHATPGGKIAQFLHATGKHVEYLSQ